MDLIFLQITIEISGGYLPPTVVNLIQWLELLKNIINFYVDCKE
jgi:hypothetical protein